jgi:hypothetical protein
MNRRLQPYSVQEAAQASPTLARLTELAHESTARLRAVEKLIPPGLRPAVQAGPFDGTSWCLLVTGNAAAAKLRQLLPNLQSCLRDKGLEINSIRLKVLIPGKLGR